MQRVFSQKIKLFVIVGLLFVSINAEEAVPNANSKDKPTHGIALMSIETNINTAKPIIKNLLELAKDKRIKGLIIHMNCNGGSAGSCEAICSELKKFQQITPVVVIIENWCYSGAYLVACAANYIFGQHASEVGSIGVKYTVKKYKDLKFNENNLSGNVEFLVYRAGKYKDLGNPYIPHEDEDSEHWKQLSQKLYNAFIKRVAECRNLSINDEKIWADGRVFVGSEALRLGLIDAIGDFSDTLAKMKELLKVKGIDIGDDFEVVEIKL